MDYRIVEGRENTDPDEVKALLKTTYWAGSRPKEKIEKSLENSDCYGIISEDQKKLIGFARVISDHATAYYLCDVIIDPAFRHEGLGKALVEYIVSRPEYKGLRGLLLTKDAHGLYEKFGFETVKNRAMIKAPE